MSVHVFCHSPSLSLLLFETTSTQNDQFGLLLGSVQKQGTTCATDENEAAHEVKTIIYIEHVVPLPNDSFDQYGESRIKLIQYSQLFKKCQIVGCYSFRWNQPKLRCSLRDSLMYKWIAQHLPSEALVLALLSATTRHDHATHSFRQLVLQPNRRGRFQSVPFKMCSLSDSLTNNEGYLHNFSLPQASAFTGLTSKFLPKPGCLFDANFVQKLHLETSRELNLIGQKLLVLETRQFDVQNELLQTFHQDSLREVQVEKLLTCHDDKKEEPRLFLYNPEIDYVAGRIHHEPRPSVDDQDSQMNSPTSGNSSYNSCECAVSPSRSCPTPDSITGADKPNVGQSWPSLVKPPVEDEKNLLLRTISPESIEKSGQHEQVHASRTEISKHYVGGRGRGRTRALQLGLISPPTSTASCTPHSLTQIHDQVIAAAGYEEGNAERWISADRGRKKKKNNEFKSDKQN